MLQVQMSVEDYLYKIPAWILDRILTYESVKAEYLSSQKVEQVG